MNLKVCESFNMFYIKDLALCEHAERWLMATVSGTMDSHLLVVSGVSSCGPRSETKMNPKRGRLQIVQQRTTS
jgi:hypothetical protein